MERSKRLLTQISVLLWTSIILFNFIEQVSCLGYIYPRGSIIRRVGEDVEIICTIDLTKSKRNSSYLSFFVGNTEVPRDNIQILNETSILLTIKNATAMSRRYACKSDRTDGVDYIQVYVATTPGKVNDFKCRSYDYEYMICKFKMPNNVITTSYNLTFVIKSQVYNCSLTRDGYDGYMCNMSMSNGLYRQVYEDYNFTLYSKNVLGNYAESFKINNHNSVIPGEFSISIENITTNSAVLRWENSKMVLYKTKGLLYEVKILSEHSNGQWKYVDVNKMNIIKSNNDFRVKLDNLEYAYTWYDIRMRKKVFSAPNTEEMWSKISNYTFRTLPKRPDESPETDIGSFYIDNSGNINLYWKQLPKYKENGKEFHYIISEVKMTDKIIDLKPSKISLTTAKFNLSQAEYEFTIKSVNAEGPSENGSIIRVPAKRLFVPQSLKKVYNQGKYTLSWSAPTEDFDVINYSVFWCTSKSESFDQCEGSINFTQVNREIRNFTYETKDIVNFAVSANTISSSSGMIWAMCTALEDSDFGIMRPIAIVESATEIRLDWNLECVYSAILEGYHLAYCPVTAKLDDCSEAEKNITIPGDAKEYKLSNLKPFTTYKITMSMFSSTKHGPPSKRIDQITLEDAPSPPHRLTAKNITSNSVVISWHRPSSLNGHLKSYEIIYNNEKIEIKGNELGEYPVFVYTLDSLKSYYDYKIYVIAHTVKNSLPSNDINIRTLIGTPGFMEQVTLNSGRNVISWSKPTVPSGPIHYYELRVVIIKNNSTVEYISKINGTKCSWRQPICQNNSHKNVSVEYNFQVRAVNVVNISSGPEYKYHTYSKRDANGGRQYFELESSHLQDADDHIEPRTSTILKRHSNAEIDDNLHENYHIVHTENRIRHNRQEKEFAREYEQDTIMHRRPIHSDDSNKFQCEQEESDEDFKKWVQLHSKNLRFLHGGWSNPTQFFCYSSDGTASGMGNIILLGSIFIVALITVLMYFTCKKYKRMKNIGVVFPPGLTDLDKEPRSKGMDNIIIKDDITRSDESLYKNENHHLLASSRVDSGYLNGIDCSDKSDVIDYEAASTNQIHHDEHSSVQSDSVEMSDMSDSSNTSPTQSPSVNIREKSPPKPVNNLVMINGYVQHNSFQKPPESANFGYTQLDAFGKPIMPNIAHSEVETKHKDINSGASENICGYVTHKQLSEFGHRLQ